MLKKDSEIRLFHNGYTAAWLISYRWVSKYIKTRLFYPLFVSKMSATFTACSVLWPVSLLCIAVLC